LLEFKGWKRNGNQEHGLGEKEGHEKEREWS
jgi:hypothetical protein